MDALRKLSTADLTAWSVHSAGLGSLIALGLALYFLVLGPTDTHHAECDRQLVELRSLLDKAPAIQTEYDAVRGELDAKKTIQQEFRRRLPSDPAESELLAQISNLARNVNLQVQEFRPGPVTTRSDYSELSIELACEGDYASIAKFLDGLPKLPRLSSLTGFDIQVEPEKPSYPIRLNISAYFVPMNNTERS